MKDSGSDGDNDFYNDMHMKEMGRCLGARDKIIEAMQKDMDNLVAKMRWISVKDQMPGEDISVLVIDKKNPSNCYVAESTGTELFYTNLDETEVYPTHWMRLPPGPEVKR